MRTFAARVRAAVCVAGIVGCAREPVVDVPVAEPIGAVIDEFPEPFTGPIRMVELRDGRLLLMDTRESRLLRLDFATGGVDSVSRSGDGPLEFRQSLFRLALAPGDSVWGYDLRRRRILVFSPDGEPLRGFSTIAADADREVTMNAPWMIGVDSAGRWLGYSLQLLDRPPMIEPGYLVLRVDPRSGRQDSITRLARPSNQRTEVGSQVVTNFEDRDAWAPLPDGRALVVRGAEYVVELHHPDGRVDTAGRVAHRRVPLTRADAERVRDSTAKQIGALVAATMANIPQLKDAPPPPTHVLPDPLPTQWPLLVEPEIAVDHQARAWVQVRTQPFDSGPTRFDVLDRDGRFVRAVELPAGELLVGFGRAHLFAARRDDDGLLWLRRYALP